MICLDNILRTSIGLMKESGFTLKKKTRSRLYAAETIMDAYNANDIALQVDTPTQAESLLYSLEQAASGIDLHVNAGKTEYMRFNQKGDIPTLNRSSLKLVDKFMYLGSYVLSTESDISMRGAKTWTAIDRLSIIWKSDLSDKMKCVFFQAAVVTSIIIIISCW